MAEIIRMPRLSDTMEEGNIVSWLKKEGDAVQPGDVLAEVETDKATMELESFHTGHLIYIGVKEGPVPVDGIIAIIGDPKDDVEALLASVDTAASANGHKEEKEESVEEPVTEPKKVEEKPVVQKAAPAPKMTEPSTASHRLKASPLAKKMAADAGLSLSGIRGSGDKGRIIKRDIESAISGKGSSTTRMQPEIPVIEYGNHPLTQMRKTIARRLGESKFSAPHFYLTMEINMGQCMEARKAINEEYPVRISYNDLIVKAAALALREHRAVNSSWLGDSIEVHKDINIGVAVAVEDGLLVPVVRNADQKSLTEIKTEVSDMAGRAKEKKLGLEEMQGNTFTISNLGMFEIDEFTAIINPPDACILAVGSIVEKPIVEDGDITVGHIMKVTLSCDHRAVDGATGARFLQTLKKYLERPIKMFI